MLETEVVVNQVRDDPAQWQDVGGLSNHGARQDKGRPMPEESWEEDEGFTIVIKALSYSQQTQRLPGYLSESWFKATNHFR